MVRYYVLHRTVEDVRSYDGGKLLEKAVNLLISSQG